MLQERDLYKFILAARRKRADTQARYFYEWGNIHVALMLTTPVVFLVFQRYAQHFSVPDLDPASLPLPLSPMEWDNMADHWVASHADLLTAVKHPDYVSRMQPHKFGDDAFEVLLMQGGAVHRQPGFVSGQGIKLLLFVAAPPGAGGDFAERWVAQVQRPMLADNSSLIRKYVHNRPIALDAAMFQGSLFARGDINKFALFDEIWLDQPADLAKLSVPAALRALADPARSFAMVTTERVIADFVTQGEITPRPAVQDPHSLEARVAAQGFENWQIPRPIAD